MFRLILLFGFLVTQTNLVHAWWNEEWAFRKVITIDTTATGFEVNQELKNVSALVRLHTGNFGYFFDIKEGGADLRFMAADDLTPLEYHVEKLDPINELALVWVKLPTLSVGVTDKIYMYYGNPAAIAAANVSGTFDEAYALALHFDEVGTPQDKTLNANHPISSTAEVSRASLMGQGALFDGTNSIQFAATPTLAMSTDIGWTFSGWLKPDAQPEDAVVMQYGNGQNGLLLKQVGGSLVARLVAAGTTYETAPSPPLLLGDWQHVAVVVTASQLQLYINGQQVAISEIPPLAMNGRLAVGNKLSAAVSTPPADEVTPTATETAAAPIVGDGFIGELDEVRVSTVARSPSWLQVNANVQGKSAQLLIYGGDESKDSEGSAEGGHGGYFGIIFDNVFGKEEAIVEQLVIGLCVVMMLISFVIMFFKSFTLYTARSATKKFLNAYQGLGTDKESFDKLFNEDKQFKDSPLFVVYKQSIIELRKRMSPAVGAEFSGLEQKSVNAIRSTMDATMVREGQRINSQIVLLTIAISGGPFIGLLGTVVGVMVVFAGIAASGEVNISAIAPGMAAALLATVSGLGVAIPALFGYNYLGSQIRELSADMHVFADEITARLNESFGR